jgi:NADH dehydrogenase
MCLARKPLSSGDWGRPFNIHFTTPDQLAISTLELEIISQIAAEQRQQRGTTVTMCKDESMNERPKVAIIGAGFAGLSAIHALAKAPVDVVLIDRNNYHTFFPLLYQIAAAELEPEEITYPVRKLLRKYPNVRFLRDEVRRIDLPNKVLECHGQSIPYDYLILTSGSVPFYFGIPSAAQNALALKTVEDGIALRNHILSCFEEAVHEPDSTKRRSWLAFAVVGGGPTGVEFTGRWPS